MTPELRKEASELQLHKRGIRINVQLHVIEADDEVTLRSEKELHHRLIALWAVGHAIETHTKEQVAAYLQRHQLFERLSAQEVQFLSEDIPEMQWRRHAFAFLAWCAGLVPKIDLGTKPCDISQMLACFPTQIDEHAAAPTFPSNVKMRRKDAIMDWSDLLYRLHWAVRHAYLNHKPSPGNIDADLVREWHQAVNWMCRYDDEDNWDLVSTETTA
ncbi:DUF4272 domain-containing protein [Undibacterium sp. LX40W]|uniref:DUF4272 domain-containing protein n=1 Tax=Undibacterium nitidum TaxID=2762298 RepID=A0A923KNZ1_9BURK|nr:MULTISPECIES: DUF4272 domain-containing protein [Undibacterium]MBC3881208.1 DUF4272 domain-containing protein [Undibacterium nitidum]MBC3890059.1 DUF4272 domain-containing protein [Undibacterium sp. LX40W]